MHFPSMERASKVSAICSLFSFGQKGGDSLPRKSLCLGFSTDLHLTVQWMGCQTSRDLLSATNGLYRKRRAADVLMETPERGCIFY